MFSIGNSFVSCLTDPSVTLVTTVDTFEMPRLGQVCRRWPGNITVGLTGYHSDFIDAFTEAALQRSEWVHQCSGAVSGVPRVVRVIPVLRCRVLTLNVVRNLAVERSVTSHYVVLDIGANQNPR